MSTGLGVLIGVGAVAFLVLTYIIVTYNRFVTLRAHMRDAWAGIEVELKRRYDLIPNLVATVKGYAAHESETLERVTALRNQALASTGSPAQQSSDESALLTGLRGLFAVVENYPELKADQGFRDLQSELVNTEDRLAATRRFYNGNVRELNELAEQFPSNLVANTFGIGRAEFFEIDDESERAVPRVGMNAPG